MDMLHESIIRFFVWFAVIIHAACYWFIRPYLKDVRGGHMGVLFNTMQLSLMVAMFVLTVKPAVEETIALLLYYIVFTVLTTKETKKKK